MSVLIHAACFIQKRKLFVFMSNLKSSVIISLIVSFLLQSHPGDLLFTKFGSNKNSLLDLGFTVRSVGS